MTNRGFLSYNVQCIAKRMIGREISKNELRLIPYIQYIITNTQKIQVEKIYGEERRILNNWQKEGFLVKEGLDPKTGKVKIQINKKFWDFMCEVLYESYVDLVDMPKKEEK